MLWWSLRQLKSSNTQKQIAAAERLGKMAAPGTLEKLKPLTTHRDPHVRLGAAFALAEIGGTESVPLLVIMLSDRNESVRLQALRGLGRAGRNTLSCEALSKHLL